MERSDILNSARLLGFASNEQKLAYIQAHFHGTDEKEQKISEVKRCLIANREINEIAKTPLFLVFICLVYDKIKKKTVFEIYKCIIWWLINRYQTDHPELNVPNSFGFETDEIENEEENWIIIQRHFLEFPLLQKLSVMAFELYERNVFSNADLEKYNINKDVVVRSGFLRCEEKIVDLRMEMELMFPHRTIQEFLAGGIYYFWPKTNAINYRLTENIFASGMSINDSGAEYFADDSKEKDNEITKFIWRAAFNFDDEICAHLEDCFLKFESLILDIELTIGHVEHLNTFLRMCKNVKMICFIYKCVILYSQYCSVEDQIDFSEMNFLHTVIFEGYRDSPGRIYFDVKPKTFENAPTAFVSTTAHIFDLPKNDVVQRIVFENVSFNGLTFIETMRYLTENKNHETEIVFNKIKVSSHNDEVFIHSASGTCWMPLSQTDNHKDNSNVESILHFLSGSEEITINDYRFDIKFPLFSNLKYLTLRRFEFSERTHGIYCLSLNNIKNLNCLQFELCTFELTSLQAMVSDISEHNKHLTKLVFLYQVFENEDYFKKFFQVLQDIRSVEELKIGINSVYNENIMQTFKRLFVRFDATETIIQLVNRLKRLKKLTITSEKVIMVMNTEQIKAAAISNGNFMLQLNLNS